MRSVKEIYEDVLSRPGRYHEVYGLQETSKDALEEITVKTSGRSFVIRSAAEGDAAKAIQATGVSLGSAVRLLDTNPSSSATPVSQEDPCSANARGH